MLKSVLLLLSCCAFAWTVSTLSILSTDCLDPDIAPPVEECEFWVNNNGAPYYLPHAKNCSRFWECSVDGTICLHECPACGPVTEWCPDGALYFDYNMAYSLVPVCDWAPNIDC